MAQGGGGGGGDADEAVGWMAMLASAQQCVRGGVRPRRLEARSRTDVDAPLHLMATLALAPRREGEDARVVDVCTGATYLLASPGKPTPKKAKVEGKTGVSEPVNVALSVVLHRRRGLVLETVRGGRRRPDGGDVPSADTDGARMLTLVYVAASSTLMVALDGRIVATRAVGVDLSKGFAFFAHTGAVCDLRCARLHMSPDAVAAAVDAVDVAPLPNHFRMGALGPGVTREGLQAVLSYWYVDVRHEGAAARGVFLLEFETDEASLQFEVLVSNLSIPRAVLLQRRAALLHRYPDLQRVVVDGTFVDRVMSLPRDAEETHIDEA